VVRRQFHMQAEPRVLVFVIRVVGVFAGSMAWWIILCAGVTLARRKLPTSFATWVNRGSGVTIAGFGLVAIWSVMSG